MVVRGCAQKLCRQTPVRNRGLSGCAHRDHHLLFVVSPERGGWEWVICCRSAYCRAATAAGRSAVVIATRAQGRMVAKVRTKPGGDRKQGCPHRKPGRRRAWARGGCIYLPGKDRRGNLGAMPGVRSAGFHTSRSALVYRKWSIADCVRIAN